MSESMTLIGIVFVFIFITFMFTDISTSPTTVSGIGTDCQGKLLEINTTWGSTQKSLDEISNDMSSMRDQPDPELINRTEEENANINKLPFLQQTFFRLGDSFHNLAVGVQKTAAPVTDFFGQIYFQVYGTIIIIASYLSVMIQLLTFMFSPCSIIPLHISLLILLPLGTGLVYMMAKLIRGGG